MIEFKNVTKSYGDKAGLSDVNLSIDDGEFVFSRSQRGGQIDIYQTDPERNRSGKRADFFPGQGYYPTAETADSGLQKRSRHRISGFSASAEKDRL